MDDSWPVEHLRTTTWYFLDDDAEDIAAAKNGKGTTES
jgi:hypothetical protein